MIENSGEEVNVMTGNRELIEECVSQNPGIGFNELKRELELSNGVLQHHIEQSDEIVKRKGAYVPEGKCSECRFYNLCGSRCLLNVTRKENIQKVLKGKAQDLKHSEIAAELDLDDSTVSYHVNKLRELGLLDEEDKPRIEHSKV